MGSRFVRGVCVVIGGLLVVGGSQMMNSLESDSGLPLFMMLAGIVLIVVATRVYKNRLPPRWSKSMRDFGRK